MSKYIIILILVTCYSALSFPQGFICAAGGGSEDYNDWSDEPYSWIVQKADSGRILVLSYSDETEWIPEYFKSLGASEAFNVKISSRSIADQQPVYDSIISAKAVFIKGGDQYRYISLWKGTRTEEAIKYLYNSGGVIAGTSAGAAVPGDIDFSAKNGSAYPAEALKDPFYSRMTFEDNFLPLVPGVIFDTHFIERGRFGRLLPMLLNIKFTLNKDITGIGIDDHTALCIEPDLTATVMGSGAVSVFYQDNNTYMDNRESGYIIEGLKCDQMTHGWVYDLVSHTIVSTPTSAQNISAKEWTFPKTNFILAGSSTPEDNRNALAAFFSGVPPLNVLILSHEGYADKAYGISSFIDSLGYDTSLLFLNTVSVSQELSADKIGEADYYIITGDSLAMLNLLSDTSYAASKEFAESINAGKPVFFLGNAGKLAGGYTVDNTDSDYLAGWRGKMKTYSSLALYGDLVFQPFVFNNEDFYENRSSSVLWGMMRNRSRLGIYLSNNDILSFNTEQKTVAGRGESPFIMVDAFNTTIIDSSVYKTGASPRQVVAMNNLRYYVSSRNDVVFSLNSKSFSQSVSVKGNNIPGKFYLEQNYPNPFNPGTTFKFYTSTQGFVSFKIYDILGRETAVLINKEIPAGMHKINFNAEGMSSGVYIAVLQLKGKQLSQKIVLLK
jgi:cyanophycinase